MNNKNRPIARKRASRASLDFRQSARCHYLDPARYRPGLFVPPELLIVENADGPGCYVLYVQPSSLVVVEDHPALLVAAQVLDAKIDAFVRNATTG